MISSTDRGDIYTECVKCGKNVKVSYTEYSYKVYNIDSDALHACFVKEWSLGEEFGNE
jgi:hypothetical protein